MNYENRVFAPKHKKEFPFYVFTPNFLSTVECDKLISDFDSKLQWSDVGNGFDGISYTDFSVRKVKQAFIPDENYEWLYKRLRDEIIKVNEIYDFDLIGVSECFQFLKYETPASGEEQTPGHYNWHQDYGGGIWAGRKISVVINLSEPTDYSGCKLELMTQGPNTVSHIDRGTMITFPSYLPHQVTNIESGTRYSLVTWIHGPRFR